MFPTKGGRATGGTPGLTHVGTLLFLSAHTKALLDFPTLKQTVPCISHHAVFDPRVLAALQRRAEAVHGVPLWQAFLRCVPADDFVNEGGASEYTAYLEMARRTAPATLRFRELRFRDARWAEWERAGDAAMAADGRGDEALALLRVPSNPDAASVANVETQRQTLAAEFSRAFRVTPAQSLAG